MSRVIDLAAIILSAVWKRPVMDTTPVQSGLMSRPSAVIWAHDWTCDGCGLVCSPTIDEVLGCFEIHHRDDNVDNDEAANQMVVCPLCHGLLHFDLMLDEGAMPGRLLWAPDLPQDLLNMLVHVRAVLEEMCRPHLAEAADRLDETGRTALKLRSTCDEVLAGLLAFDLPRGLLADPASGRDMTERMGREPVLFGRALGRFLRANPPAEQRARLAGNLHGLRWLYDWRFHPKARVYAATDVWTAGPYWARKWWSHSLGLLAGIGR